MATPADDNFEFQKIIVVLGFTLMAIKFIAYALTGSVAILTDAMECPPTAPIPSVTARSRSYPRPSRGR